MAQQENITGQYGYTYMNGSQRYRMLTSGLTSSSCIEAPLTATIKKKKKSWVLETSSVKSSRLLPPSVFGENIIPLGFL